MSAPPLLPGGAALAVLLACSAPAPAGAQRLAPPAPAQEFASAAQCSSPAQGLRALLDDGRYARAAEEAALEIARLEARPGGAQDLEAGGLLALGSEALRGAGAAADPRTRAWIERALAIGAREAGVDDARTAAWQVQLALLESMLGADDAAWLGLASALDVHRRTGPPELLARTLVAAAGLRGAASEAPSALELLAEARALQERQLPPRHPDVALRLASEALALARAGDKPEALARLETALEIEREALRPDHPRLALTWLELGSLERRMGLSARAREHLEQAVALASAELGPRNHLVGRAQAELGELAWALGDFDAARAAFAAALQALEGTFGPDSPQIVGALARLGDCMRRLRSVESQREGLALAQRALAILEAHRSPPAALLPTLRVVTMAQLQLDQDEAALSTAERALAAAPSGSPWRPVFLYARAELHERAGRFELALAAADEAVRALEADGMDASLLPHLLAVRAAYNLELGRAEAALDDALRSARILRLRQVEAARTLDQRSSVLYAANRWFGLDQALLSAREHPAAVARVWDEVVRSRALVFDVLARRSAGARTRLSAGLSAELSDELQEIAGRLAAVRSELAALVLCGQGRTAGTPRAELERERARLERALARGTPREDAPEVGLDAIARALPPGEALVAYTRIEARGVRCDLAFVLPAPGAQPLLVSLGEAQTTDALALAYLALARQPSALDACRAAGERLRAHVWDPVRASVAGAQRVWIVADGGVHLVPFPALPDGAGWLVESGPTFAWLGAERDLLCASPPRAGARGLLAVGGIDFGASDMGQVATRAAPLGGWQELPGSRREADLVAELWRDAQPGPRTALEREAVVAGGDGIGVAELSELVRGREVVHLATHAFFRPARGARGEATRGIAAPSAAAPAPVELDLDEDTLFLSGLVLSRANERAGEPEDGVLSAEEALSLDLSAARLVVLSACDSARGEVASGQGLFGLARSLHLAGAETVVHSLWPVHDQDVLPWMRAFYAARERAGADAADALRAAARAVLAERRAAGLDEHPFAWGGFVAAGRGG